MHISFRQLRLFLALAETGSVSGAARVMHVTQPTASMQLKDMSAAVGLPLYEWVGKKLYLTDIGRELAVTAREMTQTWEAFEQQVDAVKGLSQGKLRIAVVSTAQYFMPRLVGGFCHQYPQVDVSLEILNRDGVVQRLRDNLDDLYIMSMPPADMDLQAEALMPNPIVAVLPVRDALMRWPQVPLAELRERRFVLREKGSGTRMAADQFFRKMQFVPKSLLELGSNEAVKEAVAGGLGVGVLSQHALHGQQRERGVGVVPVQGFPLPSAWYIVHPSGRRLSPLAQAFRRHLMQHGLASGGQWQAQKNGPEGPL